MNYMLDKLKVHPNGEKIIDMAYDIVDKIKEDERFNDSEKLLIVDLILAKINYDLFKISGDKSE